MNHLRNLQDDATVALFVLSPSNEVAASTGALFVLSLSKEVAASTEA